MDKVNGGLSLKPLKESLDSQETEESKEIVSSSKFGPQSKKKAILAIEKIESLIFEKNKLKCR